MSTENENKPTEQEKLKAQLEKMGMTLGGLTLGDNPGSAEAVARELRKSLERLEKGDWEVETPFDVFGAPTPEKIEKDRAVLGSMRKRAEEIQKKTLDLRRELGKDLMEYAEKHLRCYTYGSHGIEGDVDEIVQLAQLDHYPYSQEDNYHFWLPSNFGC